MAQRVIISVAMAIAMLAIFSTTYVSAQSGCTTTILSLSSCLSYISGNATTPSSSCCSTLSSVVKNEPQCLCTLLNGGASSYGVTINTTKAMDLPPACKVKTPPVSLCKTLGAPAAAPSASVTPSTETPSTETPSTSSTPSVPSVSSSTGSKSTPSTTTESSSAKSNKSAVISVLVFAASALASMI